MAIVRQNMSPTDSLSASPDLVALQPGKFARRRWNGRLARHRGFLHAQSPLPAQPTHGRLEGPDDEHVVQRDLARSSPDGRPWGGQAGPSPRGPIPRGLTPSVYAIGISYMYMAVNCQGSLAQQRRVAGLPRAKA
jgi:hypothetical protein